MRALIALMLLTSVAEAHIALRIPAPRTSSQKAGPCGAAGSVRGSVVTTYKPGETITVEWDETVAHPGHFRIAFDDDGDDVFVNPNNPNDNFPFTLVEPIADKSGTQHYTQEVTLPNIECTNCTLQLMQIMTTTVPYDSFYYQCADLTLSSGGPGADAGPTADAGVDPAESGGGCSTGGTPGASIALALGALLARRRRR